MGQNNCNGTPCCAKGPAGQHDFSSDKPTQYPGPSGLSDNKESPWPAGPQATKGGSGADGGDETETYEDGSSYKEFIIALDRSEGGRLGMDVHHSGELGVATILQIEPGLLLHKWNQDHPDQAVERGDRIVEVNGVTGGPARLVSECAQEDIVKIKISRRGRSSPLRRGMDATSAREALKFDVTLDRTRGDKFGMNVDPFDGERLLVATIDPGGLVERWNEEHPDRAVRPDDTIAEVNGIHGNVQELIEECSKHTVLNMKFLRY